MRLKSYNLFGRGRTLRIAITLACQMAFTLFGYDQGVFSGIVGNPDFRATFGEPGSALEGIIVSIYNLGCFSGCGLTFVFSEKTGRRLAMWIAMGFIIVGATLQTSAFTVPHIMVARFVTGIGTGIETSTVPMYQSELCAAGMRGRLVSSQPLFVGLGIEIAYWFDYGISSAGGPIAWRLPIACQMIFALVVIVLVFGLPESLRYLYRQGRNEEALEVLCRVNDATEDDAEVCKEQKHILEALALEKEHGDLKWSQLFKKDEVQTGHRILLAWGMQCINQIGGINLVVYYVTEVLQHNVGLTRNLSLLMGGVINAMFLIGSLFPSFFLDKVGRRKPMMWGLAACGTSMMLIAILLSFQDQADPHIAKVTSSASIAFFFTYMLAFGMTINCIPWVYVPEIVSLQSRSKGMAIGISSNWIWNFTVVMLTPTLISKLAWKTYLIFMCTNLAFIPIIYFFYPETNGLTLEEIDWIFLEKHPVNASKVVAKHGWPDDSQWMLRQRRAGNGVLDKDVPDTAHDEKVAEV